MHFLVTVIIRNYRNIPKIGQSYSPIQQTGPEDDISIQESRKKVPESSSDGEGVAKIPKDLHPDQKKVKLKVFFQTTSSIIINTSISCTCKALIQSQAFDVRKRNKKQHHWCPLRHKSTLINVLKLHIMQRPANSLVD